MFNVSVEAISGARSRGYDREKEDAAMKIHDSLVRQLTSLGLMGSTVTVRFMDEVQTRTEVQNNSQK
jgi:signal transduction histidine kinase